MTYNGDSSTLYKLGWNRGRSGSKINTLNGAAVPFDHTYIQGYEAGKAAYKRDKLERLVLEDQK